MHKRLHATLAPASGFAPTGVSMKVTNLSGSVFQINMKTKKWHGM
ncbi:hypothetical protein [Pseudomonas gingeri]